MLKSNISDFYSHKYTKIRIDLNDNLPVEKTLNVHNVVILIKSVFNKNNIKMLHYDRTDVSEGSDINKTSLSKECIICHYWYVLDKGFRFFNQLPVTAVRMYWSLFTLAALQFYGIRKTEAITIKKFSFERKKRIIIKYKQFLFVVCRMKNE